MASGGLMMRDVRITGTYTQGLQHLGALLAESGFFQDARQTAQAAVKVMAGEELGLGPIASMTQIHIVQGRVTLSAHLLAALVRRSGRYGFRVRQMDPEACVIDFTENGDPIGTSSFTRGDAEAAGLWAKPGPWRQHPRNMLYARAMSNGVKWYCPDITTGAVYTLDEIESGDADEPDRVAAVIEARTVSWRDRAQELLEAAGDTETFTVRMHDAGITSQMLADDEIFETAMDIARDVRDTQPETDTPRETEPPAHQDPPPPSDAHLISQAQRTRLHAIKNGAGWADDQYRALLRDVAGVDSSLMLGRDRYEAVCTALEAGPGDPDPQTTISEETPA